MTDAGSRRARRPVGPRSKVPTLREERRLLREGHLLVAGMDEVGRGALAGPVSVGVVVVDAGVRTAPAGVRDSKLLTPAAREALVPRLRRWAVGYAVGHAEPDEIDAYGIVAALRLAGRRALARLDVAPTCLLLDGSHNWFTEPVQAPGLFELDLPGRRPAPRVPLPLEPVVLTQIKADLRCAAVAAASVLAKVERDAIMVGRAEDFPGYGWRENKGYSAPEHAAALRGLGPCPQHRRTWSLPLAERLAGGQVDADELDPDELDPDGAEPDGLAPDGAEPAGVEPAGVEPETLELDGVGRAALVAAGDPGGG
jgi:ribonuclease HII